MLFEPHAISWKDICVSENDVVLYSNASSGERKGCVFLVRDETMVHYWFSFYGLDLKKKSFGIWMMLQEIQRAKECGMHYVYLGTCYGKKGRYKMNVNRFEFWNGTCWIQNKKQLQQLLLNDEGL